MSDSAVAVREGSQTQVAPLEQVVIMGDLSKLTPQERLNYYGRVCQSLGLNPFTRPFQYLNFKEKGLQLYATRDATDQLRKINGISIDKLERELDSEGEIYTVTAYGHDQNDRHDSATGAVPVAGLRGEGKANAYMKAETKAKRRLTLSLAGLGWLDEIEVDSVDEADKVNVDFETGEIKPGEWEGTIEVSDRPGADLMLRIDTSEDGYGGQEPTPYTGFRLPLGGGKTAWVVVTGEYAESLFDEKGNCKLAFGEKVKVVGNMELVTWYKETDGKRRKMPPYRRIMAETIEVLE